MKRVTIRISDGVHRQLLAELSEWRRIRGPKFSLNDFCVEKLAYGVPVTAWQVTTGTTGTNNLAITSPITVLTAPLTTQIPRRKYGQRKK